MDKSALRNFFKPVVIVFILINALCIVFGNQLDEKGIDHNVLIFANLILFIITLIACYIHVRSLTNSNPHAFVRGVTLASFIKLIAIAVSVIIYLIAAGENRSVYAVVVAMFFYIIYTVFEVGGAMKLNRHRNVK
jgi:prepilin signal peptidase PulO-like enzyme (type II secretory pathway)